MNVTLAELLPFLETDSEPWMKMGARLLLLTGQRSDGISDASVSSCGNGRLIWGRNEKKDEKRIARSKHNGLEMDANHSSSTCLYELNS